MFVVDVGINSKYGVDYLFTPIEDSVRLLDILQYFVECVNKGTPTLLIELMWKDIVEPTLSEYMEDEAIERRLREAFAGCRLNT